jgi:tetratricopeptide (TPR) repeat protein
MQVPPGRNTQCPCGSGKKFKECCGQISSAREAESATPDEMSELAAMVNGERYLDLEKKTRDLVERCPKSGLLWQLLGVALSMQGKDAVQPLRRAATLLPADAGAQNNLANALGRLGQLDLAVSSYQRALLLKPDFAEAHCNLATALLDIGQPDEAAASCRRALEIQPDFAQAHSNLGSALLELGQCDAAVASYRRALEIKPDHAATLDGLGNALRGLWRLEEAVSSYRRALLLKPDFAEAHNNLANALLDLGQSDDAAVSYRRALLLKPDFAEAHNNLGNVFRGLGQLDAAVSSYRRALQIKPDFAEAHSNLGIALRLQGRTVEAEASCRRALEIHPNSASTISVLAESLADKGQFAEAEELFKRAISFEPESPEAWAAIVRLRKMTRDDAAWLAQAERIAERPLPPRKEVHLRYAMGKYFDDVAEFAQAFGNFQRANELTKRYRAGHDRQQLTRAVDSIIRCYDASWLRKASIGANPSARPVLIVGMLRSGTTLAEQILASHPAVFGAGELAFWNAASAAHQSSALDREMGGSLVSKLAGDYLRLLQDLSPDALRVIDKMPTNFLSLGLIHAAVPRARIIHMTRNPIDTCLSIYFQRFETALAYTNDLEDLAHYYTEYFRLMKHWRLTLPKEAILDVPYEGLVDDHESWSRRMLEFIDMPWDPVCLNFHRTERTVITASKWQVRQKISKSSVGRWHNYRKFVGPLLNLMTLDA